VGEKTEQRLLLRFGSVARIAAAPLAEVSQLVGPRLAERILKHLNDIYEK
jgi:excinuclease ABC subunit C